MVSFAHQGENGYHRNEILLNAIFPTFSSVCQFCTTFDINFWYLPKIYSLIALDYNPKKKNGEYRSICIQLSRIFEMEPRKLFPECLYSKERVYRRLEERFSDRSQKDIESVADPKTPCVEYSMENEERKKLLSSTLWARLHKLPDRDRQILELRFGLTEEKPASLKKIAERYGLSRERVRQIEEICLNKLRSSDLQIFFEK